jgi:hypothetical protein
MFALVFMKMIKTKFFLNPKNESQDHTKGSMKKKQKKELE